MRHWFQPAAAFLAVGLCAAQVPATPEPPKFGTTVYAVIGLRGDIYYIPEGTTEVPNFKKMKPVGAIYTTRLNVRPAKFTEGFPGVTDRVEWFAIDYHGRFWIEKPGKYRFALTSDDGALLYIDGHLVIDNDGIHPPVTQEERVKLRHGTHRIRVSYFQGPRYDLALALGVQGPDDNHIRIFDLKEFKPANPDEWSDEAPKARRK